MNKFKLHFFNLIAHYNILYIIYAAARLNRFVILPYRNSYLRIHRSCKSSGMGRLLLGIQHQNGRYMPSQIVMRPNSKLQVAGRFKIFSGHDIWVNKNATLVLGSGFINNNLNLSCFDRIEIGTNVAISKNVTIRDSDGHSLDGRASSAPIKIGNNVWIGLNVTILKGVTIGDGAVIAAGSLVNRDVRPKSLVAGVPAVFKKEIAEWD